MIDSSDPLFGHSWPLIGVIHLPPLPGSPFSRQGLEQIVRRAQEEAEVLVTAGFEGAIVENFGDYPFHPDEVEPHTIAAMSIVTQHVCAHVARCAAGRRFEVGINVLRNDARAAMAIAAVCGLPYIRVNVHTGAMVTDQGIVQGKAHQTLRYRKALGAEVRVLADVLVKHAHPLGEADPESVAKDTYHRGGAYGLVVSGRGTGQPVDLALLKRIAAAVPDAPVLIGSGLTLDNLAGILPYARGAIVGTALKPGGDTGEKVELELARKFVALREALLSA